MTQLLARRWRVALWLPLPLLLVAVVGRELSGRVAGDRLFFGVIALIVLGGALYVLWRLPVVYTLGAGLVLTIFSGNWEALGLPGFPFLPDRFLIIAALAMMALRERYAP